MPPQVKSNRPAIPAAPTPAAPTVSVGTEEQELAPGAAREQLEGWIPPLASDDEVRAALEKAFDYRGDVTLTLKDGTRIEGYVFDRSADGTTLADCYARLLPKGSEGKVKIRYAEVARLEFSGRDTAAGKSFQTWLKNYQARKAAGESNIGLEPEKLDEA